MTWFGSIDFSPVLESLNDWIYVLCQNNTLHCTNGIVYMSVPNHDLWQRNDIFTHTYTPTQIAHNFNYTIIVFLLGVAFHHRHYPQTTMQQQVLKDKIDA
jgi:hypothetical protein